MSKMTRQATDRVLRAFSISTLQLGRAKTPSVRYRTKTRLLSTPASSAPAGSSQREPAETFFRG